LRTLWKSCYGQDELQKDQLKTSVLWSIPKIEQKCLQVYEPVEWANCYPVMQLARQSLWRVCDTKKLDNQAFWAIKKEIEEYTNSEHQSSIVEQAGAVYPVSRVRILLNSRTTIELQNKKVTNAKGNWRQSKNSVT